VVLKDYHFIRQKNKQRRRSVETELTKEIKRRLRWFSPAMGSLLRTIRYAEEVWTPTGIVDMIRFEDYVQETKHGCKGPYPCWKGLTHPHDGCGYCTKLYTYEKTIGMLTTCYEVKITAADFRSQHGHNFCGNKNYYAVPVGIFDKIKDGVPAGVGVIVFYPETGIMRVRVEAEMREQPLDVINSLLYNALKKWVDVGNRLDKETAKQAKAIERYLWHYPLYIIGVKSLQEQLDYIMPSMTAKYELREGTASFNISSSTEKYAIDRIESKRALEIHEELARYKIIIQSIDRAMEGLAKYERLFVETHYFKGVSMQETAARLAYNDIYIYDIKNRVIAKLTIPLKGLLHI
jgi:hypothetical protein